MLSLSRAAFEQLVEEAIAAIPKVFRDKAKGVVVTVQARPGKEAEDLDDAQDLLGLYVTLGDLPPKIYLYQANLQSLCHDEPTLRRQVALTLRHELAHHLGFTDEDLEAKWPEGA